VERTLVEDARLELIDRDSGSGFGTTTITAYALCAG
jgi:hypothetical protein